MRAKVAPRVVDAQVGARLLVQQYTQTTAGAGRERLEQMRARRADRRRVEERDVAEKAVARQRVPEFDLAVEQMIAAIPAFAVPARGTAVRIAGRRGKIEVGRDAPDHEISEHPEGERAMPVV